MQASELEAIIAGTSREVRAVPSPDGTYVLVLRALEAANSQWVDSATLHARDGQLVAQIGEWNWHVDSFEWRDGGRRLALALRRYPGDVAGFSIELDLPAGTATRVDDGRSVPFAELSDWLEGEYAAARALKG